MKKTKAAFLQSAVALLLCVSMLLGTTWAWFTDSVESVGNIIQTGSLKAEMHYADADKYDGDNTDWKDASQNAIFDYEYWEPGYTELKYIKVSNVGDLAFKYQLSVIPNSTTSGAVDLADVIDVYCAIVDDSFTAPTGAVNPDTGVRDLSTMNYMGTLSALMAKAEGADTGVLLPADGKGSDNVDLTGITEYYTGDVTVCLALQMKGKEAGNEYQDKSVGGGFRVCLFATQVGYELDSFGKDYDSESEWPGLSLNTSVNATFDITAENGALTEAASVSSGSVSATVPAGVAVNEGTTQLTLTVSQKTNSESNLTTGVTEDLMALDVHVDGIAADNTTPIIIDLGPVLPIGMNNGNVGLYHVEDGVTVPMTQVDSVAGLTGHNQFCFDPATGNVIIAMASFSEVAVIADTVNAWNGNFDYSWYTGLAEGDEEYIIANADQLAAFGAIVGGMDGQTQDSFSDKTVKLIADVNLGDKESENNPDLIFYPIGYCNSTGSYKKVSGGSVTSEPKPFAGTFDGNGHTIANFYQNTWEMFGDYNSGYSGTPNHYDDAMGLFGYVNGGTVKNLTVDNFSSDGEFTPTGVIAAYAVNSTFENIAITNCNPRVYNTGNGGIVGIGGNTDDTDDKKLTFNNITIDNTNKITALWGSWDVACGGLVGMFRGAGHVYMTNCHVAAQMDVYNDVCGNYQYYWYRYSGMMVGTNKNMTTDDAGYTVPETSKFHAENCTVHFGNWNDYYYCELVANSLASYTHDHQFSRLEQISSLDEIKSGDTWTKAGNFLLISGDTKTCYHIVNKNGTLTQHKHADAGTETVNGVEGVLKENNQIVYLPFNQLFTGYGWGVKHIPIYDDGTPNPFAGVTILDREVADSVDKFEAKKDVDLSGITAGGSVTIGDLFEEIEQNEVGIVPKNIMVAVTDLTNTGITADFVRGEDDWKSGTLTFNGTNGIVKITIQDYYYCKPTSITVEIGEFNTTDRFEIKFPNTDDYLYRVGNANAVSLGSLFAAKDEAGIGDVTVKIEAQNGTAASGTYTSNATWTNGTIKFNGTGVVSVTISDDNFSTPVTLNLEVVDATNITAETISSLGSGDVVLLNNTKLNAGGALSLSNASLYGNGFELDVTAGRTTGGSSSANYLLNLAGSTIDNVKIIGAVYTKYGAMSADEYNNPVIRASGNSVIQNSYIANCAAPVRLTGGNLEIINTTLKGGNFANLDIRNGHVILDNVTTINQVNGNDTAEDGTVVVGLGVVVYYENVSETTTIEVKNGITQYNYLSETQAEAYIKDAQAQMLTDKMFNEDYTAVQHKDGSDIWVNAGILSMTGNVDDDNISDVSGYVDANPYMSGTTGYLHTKKPNADSIKVVAPLYTTVGQGTIAPACNFDYTTKNYVPKTDGSNDYCYEENGTVYISMDDGDTFNWDTSILTSTKNGENLDYTVSMNGTDYTGKSIAFNSAGNYSVTYTYTDSNNYGMDANGDIKTYNKTYTKAVHITVAVIEATALPTEFTFGSTGQATEKITVGNNTYISAKGVSHNNSTWSYITVDGQKIYYPIVEATIVDKKFAYFNVFENVVNITDTDGGTTLNGETTKNTTELPTGLTVVNGKYGAFTSISSDWSTLNDNQLNFSVQTYGANMGGKVFSYAAADGTYASVVSYKSALCYKSPELTNARDEYYTIAKYCYVDSNNMPYYYYVGYHMAKKGDGCVTPDTLITLADGSQKRVDALRGDEELLVWNMETGALDSAPILFVDSEDEAEYEIVHLYFSDGTDVKVIYEHGFWDYDLNRYVYLDRYADKYIGHTFAKQSGDKLEKVQLTDVVIETEVTTAWSPVTEGHLCYFVNGMLSMPGGVGGLFNIFDVDADTMTYDYEAMARDIETYGLFTYEELNAIVPLSEDMFNAAGGAYLKVSIGKGNLTMDELIAMINRYSVYFN